jgi:hypothetical protein
MRAYLDNQLITYMLSSAHGKLPFIKQQNDFDARYIANAMLPVNRIDVFLTADKKSIWNHRADIKARFGVGVKLPYELAEEIINYNKDIKLLRKGTRLVFLASLFPFLPGSRPGE